ncbi:MAG: GAF domain-containing protein [Dehalococcoidia bacterium]
MPLGGSIAGAVWRSGEPCRIKDLDASPHTLRQEATTDGRYSQIVVPLYSSGEKRLGLVSVASSSHPEGFSDRDERLLSAFCEYGAAILLRAQEVAARREVEAERARLEGVLLRARGVAHDLNQELGVIMGRTDILAMLGTQLEPQFVRHLEPIREASRRLAKKITRLQQTWRVVTQDAQGVGPYLDIHASSHQTLEDPLKPQMVHGTRERMVLLVMNGVSCLRPSEASAIEAWAALITADAEQVARVRESAPPADYYQATAPAFRPGGRLEAVELPLLLDLARPDDTWLDIGAGAGRFAVPLAAHVTRVIAIEPNEAMRSSLHGAIAEAGRPNIDVANQSWPVQGWQTEADVSLAAHALYDIAAIGPFLDAMERHSRRLCVVSLVQFARGAHLAPLFAAVHGEPVQTLPGLKEFVALLGARNRRYEVRTAGSGQETDLLPREDAFNVARGSLWLAPGSAKEQHMRSLMETWWGSEQEIAMPAARRFIGVVSWQPPRGVAPETKPSTPSV